ncbi:MAG: hypothetical protein R3217_09755, partial [Gammaproteobacteria bacterium]|nr:hypothetical protein [Gammaproteobacteria bacterium]
LPEVEVVRMPNGRSFFTGKAFMEFDYKGVRYLAYKDKVSDEDFEIHPGKMGYHPETSELCWALHRAVNG